MKMLDVTSYSKSCKMMEKGHFLQNYRFIHHAVWKKFHLRPAEVIQPH